MRKCQYLLFMLKRSYICYYIICMIVPLKLIMLIKFSVSHSEPTFLFFFRIFCSTPIQFSNFGINITENIGLKCLNIAPFRNLLYSVTYNENKQWIDVP